MALNEIKIQRLSDDAQPISFATDGSAGFDLRATENKVLYRYESATIKTGWAMEVPKHHVVLLFSRSGHAKMYGVRLSNCVGVIDSDYRGEVQIMLTNDGERVMDIEKGDRVAQGILLELPPVMFTQVEKLTETRRGDGGFGSTGR